MHATAKALAASGKPELQAIAQRLGVALKAWTDATDGWQPMPKTGLSGVLTAAVPYLHLAVTGCGLVHGQGRTGCDCCLEKGEGDQAFYRAKVATARFYADQMLPLATSYGETVKAGDAALAGWVTSCSEPSIADGGENSFLQQ